MKSLQDVIHAMEQDGMKTVNKLYPDLTLVKSVKNGESENIGGMGDEDWMYSKSYDITVAVCAHMNTPAYVFKGTTLSATELAKAKSTSTEMAAMTTAKGTSYQNYSEAVMNSALKSGQKVIVFFHAEWCATCRALEANIKANLTQIPANVLILQANFDTETALKQKYGITVKTSFAVLNADGSLEKKLVGPKDLQEILK